MNGTQLTDVSARLAIALTAAGLVVERAESIGGQLRYATIPPEAFLGRLLSLGWRVSVLIPGEPAQRLGPDPLQCHLRLVADRRSETVGEEDSA